MDSLQRRPHVAGGEFELTAPVVGPGPRPLVPTGGLYLRLEFRGLVEHIEEVDAPRDHLATDRDQVSGNAPAADRVLAHEPAVGEVDLDDPGRVDREKQPSAGQEPAAARPDARRMRPRPALPPSIDRHRIDAVGPHEDQAAVDDAGDLAAARQRPLPGGGAIAKAKADKPLGVVGHEKHATSGDHGPRVAAAAGGRFPEFAGEPAKPRRATDVLAAAGRKAIAVCPEQRAGGEVNRHHGAAADRTDEHSFVERRRETSQPPGVAVGTRRRLPLLEVGERL